MDIDAREDSIDWEISTGIELSAPAAAGCFNVSKWLNMDADVNR